MLCFIPWINLAGHVYCLCLSQANINLTAKLRIFQFWFCLRGAKTGLFKTQQTCWRKRSDTPHITESLAHFPSTILILFRFSAQRIKGLLQNKLFIRIQKYTQFPCAEITESKGWIILFCWYFHRRAESLKASSEP